MRVFSVVDKSNEISSEVTEEKLDMAAVEHMQRQKFRDTEFQFLREASYDVLTPAEAKQHVVDHPDTTRLTRGEGVQRQQDH